MRRRAALRWGQVLGSTALAGTLVGCGSSTLIGRVPKPTGHPLVRSPSAVAVRAVTGPVSARTRAAVAAGCRSGSSLLSGGVEADLTTGGAPNPSLRLVTTLPVMADRSASGAMGDGWQVAVASGGVAQGHARTTAFAMCAPSTVPGMRVVTRAGPGPSAAASEAYVTAQCPPGMLVMGGGGEVNLVSGAPGPPQYFLTGSYPSTATGDLAASGSPASAWTAVGALGGAGTSGARVEASAVCAPRSSGIAEVATVTRRGPSSPQTAIEATATCGSGTHLTGGGVYTGPPRLGHALQGLHLRGTFPSEASGARAPAGARVESWSVIANSGGIVTVGARTTAFALCTG